MSEPKVKPSYIIRNEFGAFCGACQELLGIEGDDWDTCDACGGEGLGDDDYDPFDDEDSPANLAETEG